MKCVCRGSSKWNQDVDLIVAQPFSNCGTWSKGENIEGENKCIDPCTCQALRLYYYLIYLTSVLWIDFIPIVPAKENGIMDWWESLYLLNG